MRRETPTSKAYSFQPGKMPVPVSTDFGSAKFLSLEICHSNAEKVIAGLFCFKIRVYFFCNTQNGVLDFSNGY